MFALAVAYDWQRLHSYLTPQDLTTAVTDYQDNFPCVDCREHFTELLETHPFPLEYVQTESDCQIWTWLTHNLVNVRLNKPWQPFHLDCKERCMAYETEARQQQQK